MFASYLSSLARRVTPTRSTALVPLAALSLAGRSIHTQRAVRPIRHILQVQPTQIDTNATQTWMKEARRTLTTSTLVAADASTPPAGGSPVSGGGSEVHRRLNSLETKLDSGHVRSHSAMQELTTQVQRMRAILEEANEREIKVENEFKKVTTSNYLTTTLFLLYLFGVSTWMVLLLNDLSGHMHGIPVVRMIHTRRDHPINTATDGPVQPVDPADMRDIDTQPQPLPTYDAATRKQTK